MSHCDQETLSLLALGESPSPDHERHLSQCAECRDELGALRSVVRTARTELSAVIVHDADGKDATEGTPVTRIPPPPRVWERIAAATGVSTHPRPEVVIARSTDAPASGGPVLASRNGSGALAPDTVGAMDPLVEALTTPSLAAGDVVAPTAAPAASVPAAAGAAAAVPAASVPAAAGASAAGAVSAAEAVRRPVARGPAADAGPEAPRPAPRARSTARPPRPRRELGMLAGVGAVALIVGLLGGVGLSEYLSDRPSTTPAQTVVAGTALRGLPLAPAAAGDASVVQTASGRELDVDVRRLAPTSGFYEVWLINPTVTKMVAVGVLHGSKGQFTVPEGVDLSEFPLVDVSIQGYDGTGQHSGKSVLRGSLRV